MSFHDPSHPEASFILANLLSGVNWELDHNLDFYISSQVNRILYLQITSHISTLVMNFSFTSFSIAVRAREECYLDKQGLLQCIYSRGRGIDSTPVSIVGTSISYPSWRISKAKASSPRLVWQTLHSVCNAQTTPLPLRKLLLKVIFMDIGSLINKQGFKPNPM